MEILKKNLPVIISVIIAIVAGVLIYTVIKAQAPSMPVVVANQHMKVGTVLSSENVTIKHFPATAVPGSSFSSVSEVTGGAIINGPIIQGDIIRSEHLSSDGSLMATLKTFAPKGWAAVELPPGGGAGMKGIKRGDVVDLYSETGSDQGIMVDVICAGAVVLLMPNESQDRYVVAVPQNYVPAIAELVVHNKPITLSLPN